LVLFMVLFVLEVLRFLRIGFLDSWDLEVEEMKIRSSKVKIVDIDQRVSKKKVVSQFRVSGGSCLLKHMLDGEQLGHSLTTCQFPSSFMPPIRPSCYSNKGPLVQVLLIPSASRLASELMTMTMLNQIQSG
jgi:hypothetical protein